MPKHYDCLFSLGAACASSQALRFANMQFASYPFDWVGGSDIVTRARLVANGFEHWLDADLLELTDVLLGKINQRIYRNRLTGISFIHDFPVDGYLEDDLPVIREKYDRRIRRLYADVERSKAVLVVYNEVPYRPKATDADILAAHRLIQERFPGVCVDLVYFSEDLSAKTLRPTVLTDHVTAVAVDYHAIEDGFVSLAANPWAIIRYLRENACTTDRRTDEEKRRFAEIDARRDEVRYAGRGLTLWINKRVYRLYRRIERFLVERGVLPRILRPVRLYEGKGERQVSLGS